MVDVILARVYLWHQVEFRVSSNPPARPVAVSKWLDPTGQLPLASALNAVVISEYDIRGAEDGGCDSPAHVDGCHPYYLKVDACYGSGATPILIATFRPLE